LPTDLGENVGLVTLRQVVLGIKTKVNWTWPLFLSVDVSWNGGDISAVFHRDNETEATTMLSYLPVFLVEKYGEQIWRWFSVECRNELLAFQWDPEQKYVVEITTEEAGFLGSFHGGMLTDWEEVEESDIADDKVSKMTFDLGFHFNLKPREEGGAGFNDTSSMATMKTGTSNATFAAANMPDNEIIDVDDDPSAASATSAQQTGVSNSNK